MRLQCCTCLGWCGAHFKGAVHVTGAGLPASRVLHTHWLLFMLQMLCCTHRGCCTCYGCCAAHTKGAVNVPDAVLCASRVLVYVTGAVLHTLRFLCMVWVLCCTQRVPHAVWVLCMLQVLCMSQMLCCTH